MHGFSLCAADTECPVEPFTFCVANVGNEGYSVLGDGEYLRVAATEIGTDSKHGRCLLYQIVLFCFLKIDKCVFLRYYIYTRFVFAVMTDFSTLLYHEMYVISFVNPN